MQHAGALKRQRHWRKISHISSSKKSPSANPHPNKMQIHTCALFFSPVIVCGEPKTRACGLYTEDANERKQSMNEKIIALIFQFVTHVINAGGYAGIIALITLNSSGTPIPSELIMPISGYLVYLGRF